MKKILIIGLVIVLSFALVGCNPFSDSSEVTFYEHNVNGEVTDVQIGDTTVGNLPATVTVDKGSHTVSWVWKSPVGSASGSRDVTIADGEDEVSFYMTGSDLKREHELD